MRLQGFIVILNVINFATISGESLMYESPRNPHPRTGARNSICGHTALRDVRAKLVPVGLHVRSRDLESILDYTGIFSLCLSDSVDAELKPQTCWIGDNICISHGYRTLAIGTVSLHWVRSEPVDRAGVSCVAIARVAVRF